MTTAAATATAATVTTNIITTNEKEEGDGHNDSRTRKALDLVKNVVRNPPSPDGSPSFSVHSQTNGSRDYQVTNVSGEIFVCTCPDFEYRTNIEACKHIHAVKLFLEKEEQEKKKKAASEMNDDNDDDVDSNNNNKTTISMVKKFSSSKYLNAWLDSPINQKLYRVLFVDKTKNTIKVEGRPLPPI